MKPADRVLIVDDSRLVRRQLTVWLQEVGYAATAVGTAAAAIAAVAADPPDLVLLDLVLPDRSGIDTCHELKQLDETARIPVIMLTAGHSSHNRLLALEAGADEFVGKPPIKEELLARVRSLLRSKHLTDHLLSSYRALDRLGSFAEVFSSQPVADWSSAQVASSMAEQYLDPDGTEPGHAIALWGGRLRDEVMAGGTWWLTDQRIEGVAVRVARGALTAALAPFSRGDGEYFSTDPPPPELTRLLALPKGREIDNFVALWSGEYALLAAGCTGSVGSWALPPLRSLIRHWGVYERIRHEAQLAEAAFFSTMDALALAAEFYDQETAGHVRRVALTSGLIAEALGCSPNFVKWIVKSAALHDVGKITMPLDLVRKPGLFTPDERALMQTHTVNGEQILGNLPALAMARNIARFHHESQDGSGYPDRLAGEAIPLEARIVKVADVYDALCSARPYKPARSHAQALEVLVRGEGPTLPDHFDPHVPLVELEPEVAKLHHHVRRSRSSLPGPESPEDRVVE